MRRSTAIPILLLVTLASAPAATAAAWTIPGIVNVTGLNSTRFVSDLAVTNPGTVPAVLIMNFVPRSDLPQKIVLLEPGQTVVYKNALEQLWGASGVAGAISVLSDQALLVRARTYNAASSGTYGSALPVVEDSRLIEASESAHTLWVTQSSSGDSGFRTNLAVIFPDAAGGAATVTLYDENGIESGSKDYQLDAAGFQQASVASFATGPLPVGRARIVVTRGRAAGYAAVVDNVTGDSSIFPFDELPAGAQDVLVNGVARASGRNGTFFRTDGRFYNPGPSPATVRVAFHASQDANPSPLTRDFAVPAGGIRDVVDVLVSLLDLPAGNAGALRFTSETPVAILCRTSNVDPTGVRPGTYGAQQRPQPLQSFLMSADGGAAVTGLRQDSAFRTNIGFAAGAEGAAFTLALKSAAGTAVATAAGSLGAYGWTQPSVQDLFAGVSIPENATLQVNVTAGSVDIFDSSIDNASGDPVVEPLALLPVSLPASATIGPQGGSIRSADGRLTLKIPAGALAAPTAIGVALVENVAPNGRGSAYTLSPGRLAFDRPVLLVLSYSKADFEGAAPGTAGLLFRDGASWFGAAPPSLDPSRRTLTASLSGAAVASSVRSGPRPAADSHTDVALSHTLALAADSGVVLTGGTLGVKVTSAPRVAGQVVVFEDLFTSALTWYVNEVSLGNGLVGFLDVFDYRALYGAPSCVPSDNPVRVRVFLRRADGREFDLVVRIAVLARDWWMSYVSWQGLTCQQTSSMAYGYRAQVDSEFSISDALTVVSSREIGRGTSGTPPSLCGSDCSVEMGPVPNIELIGLALNSYLDLSNAQRPLNVRFYLRTASPSFTVRCQGGTTSVLPQTPYASYFRWFPMPPEGGTVELSSAVSGETLTLKPGTPTCR